MTKNLKLNSVFSYKASENVRDEINLKILRELQKDPRLPMTKLGSRVGLSPPAVTERVRRLEEDGIIKGFQMKINPIALGLPIAAYIRVRPNSGQLQKIAEVAQSIAEVAECHRVTGEDCFVIKIYLPNLEQLDRILDIFLRYGTTTTSLIQSSPVTPRSPPLPEE